MAGLARSRDLAASAGPNLAIERWSGSSAEMDVKVGGKFSLWEGAIHGINRKITISQIHQDWKEKTWENYSEVIINIIPRDKGEVTEIELIHKFSQFYHILQMPERSLYNSSLVRYLLPFFRAIQKHLLYLLYERCFYFVSSFRGSVHNSALVTCSLVYSGV